MGGHDDPGRHDHEEHDLAGDIRRSAAQAHIEPAHAQGDGDDRIRHADNGLHRRQVFALLEGVLVEDVAGRPDDHEHVDRPVGEHRVQPAAEFRRHELDQEGRDPVIDTAGHRQRQPPQVRVPGRDEETAAHHHDQPDGQRRQDAEADAGPAA
jgi:hypothetical protein